MHRTRMTSLPLLLLQCLLFAASTAGAFSTGGRIWQPPSQNRSQRKGRVFTIAKPEDLLDFIIEDDQLCVVKVYASWCVTCKQFDARYRKIVNQYGSDGGQVRFAEMRYDSNEELCRDVLKISTFPYILMYKGSQGKVEGFHCTPAKYQQLVEAVNHHLGGMGGEETITRHNQQHVNPTDYGVYDGKLWDHAAKKDVYDRWSPLQPRSPSNFNPFELYKGNAPDALGYYPGEPRYKEPLSGNVSSGVIQLEEADAIERNENPKPGSERGCPGCKN